MSDILDESIKIAQEKGLITKSAEETNPRFSSETIEDIKKKYNTNAGEKTLMELAHPESVYYSPSYDRIHGLIENEYERQNVSIYIAKKPSHGKLINERYVKAHQDLVLELTKIAFELDKKNQNDLMVLADECSGKLVKESMGPLIGPGVIAATWAATYLIPALFASPVIAGAASGLGGQISGAFDLSEGLKSDVDDALEQFNDILDEEPEAAGEFQNTIDILSKLKEKYSVAYEKKTALYNLLRKVFLEKNEKFARSMIEKKYDKEIYEFFKNYQQFLTNVMGVLPISLKELKKAKAHYGHTGGMFYSAVNFVFGDDFDEAVDAVQRVIKGIGSEYASVSDVLTDYQKLQNAVDETKENTLKSLEGKEKVKSQFELDLESDHGISNTAPGNDNDLKKLFEPMSIAASHKTIK